MQKSGPQKEHSSVAECRRQSPVFREAKDSYILLGKVPERRGLRKEVAPENFIGAPLSLWLKSNLCIHKEILHETGLYTEEFPELTQGWESFKVPPARVERPC